MLNGRDFGFAGLALSAAALARPRIVSAQGPVVRGCEISRADALAKVAYVLGLECYVYGFPRRLQLDRSGGSSRHLRRLQGKPACNYEP